MKELVACLAVAGLLLGGCGRSASRRPASIRLSSPAFAAGGAIPRQFTCDGRDISPPLRWSGVPAGSGKLTLVMRDPDAPAGNFIHWSVTGLPPGTSGLPPGRLPAGAAAGRNSFGTLGYRGPCPPRGAPHHYVFKLLAGGVSSPPSGTLVGTYARR